MKEITNPSPFVNKFLTCDGEKIIAVVRKHWFVLFGRIFMLAAEFCAFLAVCFALFIIFERNTLLFFTYSALLGIAFAAALIKIYIDWYSHIYIVTSRKLLEVCCAPLFSHTVSEVLLDKVRCTEVDVHIGGVVSELLDIGTITLTFDRPTHQEEFVMVGIANPNIIGPLLADEMMKVDYEPSSQLWYRKQNTNRLFYSEELPRGGMIYATN